MDWYRTNQIDVIQKYMNPPNCPQLRPFEQYGAIVKGKEKKKRYFCYRQQKNDNSLEKICSEGGSKSCAKSNGIHKNKKHEIS